jgi:hypothetical protein
MINFNYNVDARAVTLSANASSNVDFPEPLGPIMAIIDPGSAYPAAYIHHGQHNPQIQLNVALVSHH